MDFSLIQDMFKDITEAYSIIGDPDKRARYDQLIFGDSSRGEFQNQEAYEYWKERKSGGNRMKDSREKQQERVREKLKNYTDYNDFLNRYEHHREKNGAREHLYRGEGFKDLNQKYGTEYDHFQAVDEENSDKYVKYRERFYENYWDTKENHAYYSQPATTRAWQQLKKVITFYSDLALVWGLFLAVFVLFNAHTTAKKTNVSHAYLQIFTDRSLNHLEISNHYENKYTDADFAEKYRPKTTDVTDPNKSKS